MIFFTPDINDLRYTLDEEESGHVVRVLRLKSGDEITLVDGHGGYYHARIVDSHPRHCQVEVTEHQTDFGKRPYYLHIGISPTKSIDRFEWFVEKAVEIGVDKITPLLCEHSERKHLNTERLQRIMVAAMKQSQKAYLPQLNMMTVFNDWLETANGHHRFIAYCGEGDKQSLKTAYQTSQNTMIAIGPEGDFSDREIEQAIRCGFKGISLGENRLRTETAGVAACHSIYFMNSE